MQIFQTLFNLARNRIHDCAIGAKAVVLDELRTSPSRGLYVGVSGDVSCVLADGQTVLFTAMVAGVIHPIAVVKVNGDGATTATNLVYTV
jgi:hypothetical protein